MKPDASSVSVLSTEKQSAAPGPEERSLTIRNGLLCTLIFAACFWISWPVAQMGFVDDWSYIKSAQVFAQTGRFVYNGWATAMLGWQIIWGALFIRLFGFSFMTVKLSTFPLACASVFLFYVIQVRFGIRPRNAVIGTLALGLSPLFLPLAASFMSDIPGLFVILLCLYCCQRAIAAQTSASTIAWLSLAAASNVAGGTARQIAWLGALVMVPATAWFLRKRRGVLPAGALLWAGAVAGVLYCMHWFAAQPYAISESLFRIPASKIASPFFVAFACTLAEFLCLLLVLFPVMSAWLSRIPIRRRASLAAIASLLFLWTAFQVIANWTIPWMPNLLLGEFSAVYAGHVAFPRSACLTLSALIALAFVLFLATVRSLFRAGAGFAQSAMARPIFWLLVPFSLSYCVMLVLHALQPQSAFDRYLLGIMPAAIILLIRLYELRIGPRLPAIAVAACSFFALLAVAGTHNLFASQRAQLAAIAELREAGIPRTSIQGGFEYDGWTQIENGGYINDARIKVPPGAYHANDHVPRVAGTCSYQFSDWTPALRPAYTIVFPIKSCFAPSKFPPVTFRAWLPPYSRTVYIQQFLAPSPQPNSTSDDGHSVTR
jgi:hypothetical protein